VQLESTTPLPDGVRCPNPPGNRSRPWPKYASSPTYGPPLGIFVSPTRQIDDLLASGATRSEIEVALGLGHDALQGGSVVRIDIPDPFHGRGLRLPDPKMGNPYHQPGTGRTLGGINEQVIDSPIKHDPWITSSEVDGL